MSDAVNPPQAKPKKKTPDFGPEFLVSSAPHLSDSATTKRIMFEVVAAMIPLFLVSVYMYRMQAVVLTVVTVAGCLVAEAVANWMRGRSQASLSDGSAIVTGMILAFSLPASISPYMAFIGGAIAIVLAKAVFGGLGQNLFNPAMVGRAFLMICFPAAMVAFSPTAPMRAGGVDAVTSPTPLYQAAKFAENTKKAAVETDEVKKVAYAAKAEEIRGEMPGQGALFVGNVSGCVGETSALAALIGGLFLVIRRVADWRQPVGVLGSVVVFAVIAKLAGGESVQNPLFYLNSGALMFGAFFIATDYVGAPVNPTGRLIFGVGVGVLVMLIRLFGAYPEGFMFAILIMNSLTPLIERWTVPTPFGGHVAN